MRAVVFNDTSLNGHFGCHAVMCELQRGMQTHGIEPVGYWPCGADWRDHKQVIFDLEPDVVLVNGEGSIHSSETRPRARYLAQLGSFARDELQVPAVLMNSSMVNLDAETLGHLGAFNSIYIRESWSQNYLAEHGIGSKLVPDLSFFTPPKQLARTEGVFVTDSVLRPVSRQLEELAREHGYGFQCMVERRTKGKLARWFDKWRGPVAKPEPIPQFAQSIPLNAGFDAFLTRLAQSRGVITGRLHTMTLSLVMGTPLLAIDSNTPKIAAVLEDIFGECRRTSTPDQVRQVFDAAGENMPWVAKELEALASYVQRGESAKNDMFAAIRGLV